MGWAETVVKMESTMPARAKKIFFHMTFIKDFFKKPLLNRAQFVLFLLEPKAQMETKNFNVL
jgi:hypothetical protein